MNRIYKIIRDNVFVEGVLKKYLILYCLFLVAFSSVGGPMVMGEWDDYTIPIASFFNDHNLSISDGDVQYYKGLFPDWAEYVDNYGLSGFFTKSNSGQMPWYFPTYAFFCVPMTGLLRGIHFPTIYAFPYTNIVAMMFAFIIVLYKLKASIKYKCLIIGALSINPIIPYIRWASAEVLIYSMIIVSLVFWYNRMYKRAAIFLSIAGTLNPVIMSVGFIMIAEYFVQMLKDRGESKVVSVLKNNIGDMVRYGCCFFIGVIPMIYNYYNTGHINLTASYEQYTQGNESVMSRFFAYFYDLNFGFFPYYSCILLVAVILLIMAIYKRHFRYVGWIIAFLMVVLLYSFMIHINSGMTGISRYNSWSSVILIFAVVLFSSNIVNNQMFCKLVYGFVTVGVLLTGMYVIKCGPNVSYLHFSPIAKWVLKNEPELYNPLPSTFNSRTNHIDGGYSFNTPIVYLDDDGYVRKILANEKDTSGLLMDYYSNNISKDHLEQMISHLSKDNQYISFSKEMGVYRCPVLEPDITLHFAKGIYDAEKYIINGLSEPEEWGAWTNGKELTMGFRINDELKNLHCEIKADVFNERQTVNVRLNEKEVIDFVDFRGGSIAFDFRNPGSNQPIILSFELPDAISPLELNQSNDSRKLALAVESIKFEKLFDK